MKDGYKLKSEGRNTHDYNNYSRKFQDISIHPDETRSFYQKIKSEIIISICIMYYIF